MPGPLITRGGIEIFEETGKLIGCEYTMADRAVKVELGHLLRKSVGRQSIIAPSSVLAVLRLEMPTEVGLYLLGQRPVQMHIAAIDVDVLASGMSGFV